MTVLSRNNDKSYITCLLYACHHRIICFSGTVTLGQGLTRLCLTTCNSRSRYIIMKLLPTFVDEWIVLKNQVKVLGFSLQTSAPVSSRLCRLQKTYTNLLVLDQLRSFQVKKKLYKKQWYARFVLQNGDSAVWLSLPALCVFIWFRFSFWASPVKAFAWWGMLSFVAGECPSRYLKSRVPRLQARILCAKPRWTFKQLRATASRATFTRVVTRLQEHFPVQTKIALCINGYAFWPSNTVFYLSLPPATVGTNFGIDLLLQRRLPQSQAAPFPPSAFEMQR